MYIKSSENEFGSAFYVCLTFFISFKQKSTNFLQSK